MIFFSRARVLPAILPVLKALQVGRVNFMQRSWLDYAAASLRIIQQVLTGTQYVLVQLWQLQSKHSCSHLQVQDYEAVGGWHLWQRMEGGEQPDK